jgi:hypothetical protein
VIAQVSDIEKGIQAGTRRAQAEIDTLLESPGENLRNQILELFRSWPSDLSSRFVIFYSEMVTVATIARMHYNDISLADEDLRSFLGHSEQFFNSFKHK